MNELELEELINGCVRGDRRFQHKLYVVYGRRLMGICVRYAKDKDEAQDILQEGLLKIYNNIKNFNNAGSFEGWIKRIMSNTCIDYYRKSRNNIFQVNSEKIEKMEEGIEDEKDEESNYPKIDSQIVLSEIQKLTPAYRMIFNMYVIDGHTHKEIAELLGINEGTSKSNLAKAKRNLRFALDKHIVKNG